MQPDHAYGRGGAGVMDGALNRVALSDESAIVGISVVDAGDGTGYNFGERGGALSGYVYFDADGNGARNSGDNGLTPVTVRLRGTTLAGSSVDKTARTSTAGFYSFDALPGTYTLEEIQPFGFVDGTTSIGTVNGNHLTLKGSRDAIDRARRTLDLLYEQARTGRGFSTGDVDGALQEAALQGQLFPSKTDGGKPSFEHVATRKRGPVKARNAAQDWSTGC